MTKYGNSDENLLPVSCDNTRARDDGGAWARGGEAQRAETTATSGRSKCSGGNLGTLSQSGEITIGDPIPIWGGEPIWGDRFSSPDRVPK